MNLNEIIKLRRNVKPKLFTGDLIPDALVTEILSTANWAPTHRYTEPWRFVVFSGASLISLAEFQADLYKSSTPVDLYKELMYTKLKTTPLLASHIIA
ncbi:MAG: nitroreductase, partial [Flavobacteriales bacterium]